MAYFANGSEGEVLDAQCADCPLGYGWNDPKQQRLFDVEITPKPCPIYFVQLTYNYDQCENEKLAEAMALLIDDSGVCKVRKLLEESRTPSPATPAEGA